MKILSFADTRFPIERANGVQTMATCHALAVRGHDVTLLVRPDSESPARDPFAFYGVSPIPGLSIRVVNASGGAMARRARMLFEAMRMTLAGAVDLIYTRDLGFAALMSYVPTSSRPPFVYESHGLADVVSEELSGLLGRWDLQPPRRKLLRLERREARVWLYADAYVTITRGLADELADRYGQRPNVFVVPDGLRLPAPSAPAPAKAGVSGVPPLAAYAGHLYPWKGVDVFVQALALAPAIHGLIVGGHPGEADLARVDALVGDLGVSDRVRMTGLVPPPQVAATLAGAAMLVLPNTRSAISERFTSPLKLFEYLALGLPIVASDLPAIREILTDDRTAVLVPAGDPPALAAALTSLAADAARAMRLGAAARALAPEYTWERRAERLESALSAATAR